MKRSAYIKAAAAAALIAAISAGIFAGCTPEGAESEAVTSSPYEVTMHDRPTNGLENSDELLSEPESSEEQESSEKPESAQDSVLEQKSSADESSEEESPEESEKTSVPETKKLKEGDVSVIPELSKKYFVSRLDTRMKKNFALVYEAAAGFKERAEFPEDIPEDDLTTIMYLLNYDCPELFHTKGDYYPIYSAVEPEKISAVGLTYCMSKEMYPQVKAELDHYIGSLKVELYGKNEYEKEKAVYDKLFSGLTYTERDLYSGSIYGCLLKGRARCEGICKSVMWCLRKMGMECLCVSGSQFWNDSAVYLDHSWNIVRIDGKYYHLDLTLDDLRTEDNQSIDPIPHYGFFNVDDDFIEDNRRINSVFTDLGVPVCSTVQMNYHIVNDLYISVNDNVRDRAFEIMRRYFRNEELEAVSIKCQDKKTFQKLSSEIYGWMTDFLDEVSIDKYKLNTYANELSNTLIIEAVKRE